jgi:mitochondrial chaperone BCS1
MSFLQLTSIFQRNSSSTQPLVHIPANLLDAFVPGYGTILRLLLEIFGFDVTVIVSISFLVFALVKSVDFRETQSLGLVMRFGTCSVELSSDGDTYDWLMDWLADHGIGRQCLKLIALTKYESTS